MKKIIAIGIFIFAIVFTIRLFAGFTYTMNLEKGIFL